MNYNKCKDVPPCGGTICVECDTDPKRLLLVVESYETESSNIFESEMQMRGRIATAYTERRAGDPGVRNIEPSEGDNIDFIFKSAPGPRKPKTIGVRVVARAEGVSPKFLTKLLPPNEKIDELIIAIPENFSIPSKTRQLPGPTTIIFLDSEAEIVDHIFMECGGHMRIPKTLRC